MGHLRVRRCALAGDSGISVRNRDFSPFRSPISPNYLNVPALSAALLSPPSSLLITSLNEYGITFPSDSTITYVYASPIIVSDHHDNSMYPSESITSKISVTVRLLFVLFSS